MGAKFCIKNMRVYRHSTSPAKELRSKWEPSFEDNLKLFYKNILNSKTKFKTKFLVFYDLTIFAI